MRSWLSWVLLGGLALGCAPGKRPARQPTASTTAAPSPFAKLAAAFHQPRSSIEAVLPDEVRAALPPLTPPPSAAELLEMARRYDIWSAGEVEQAIDAEMWQKQLMAAALVERASHDETPESYEASALLATLLRNLAMTTAMVETLSTTAKSLGTSSSMDGAQGEKFRALCTEQMMFHIGRVLEHGAPPKALGATLKLVLAMFNMDREPMLAMTREYRSLRGSAFDASDRVLLLRATAAHLDAATFEHELHEANAAVMRLAESERRPLLAQLAQAKTRQAAARRLDQSHGDGVDAHLARFDALIALERRDDADAELAKLTALAPHDGRVRARMASRVMAKSMLERGMYAALQEGRRVFFEQSIDTPSVDDARLLVGLELLPISQALLESSDNLLKAAAPMATAIDRYQSLDAEGAAGLSFMLAQVRSGRATSRETLDRLINSAPFWTELSQLRARHPRNVDVIRLVHWIAVQLDEPRRAIPLVKDLSGIDPERDPTLALASARTLLTLTAISGDTSMIGLAEQLLEPIPPNPEREIEGERSSLFADAAMLDAITGKQGRWSDAANWYALAARQLPKQLMRLGNNHAFARSKATGFGPAVRDLYTSTARGTTEQPQSIPMLNVGAQDVDAVTLYAAVEEPLRGVASTDLSLSARIMLLWLVGHAPNQAAARRHARTLPDKPHEDLQPTPKPGWPLVCEGDVKFSLSLDAQTRGYEFHPGAGCKLWLLEGGLPNEAALKKLRR